MATTVAQEYGPDHWDSGFYEGLKAFLKDQTFKKGLEIGFAWSMSCRAFLETQPDATLLSIDVNDAMNRADEMERMWGDRWSIIYGDSSTEVKKLKDKYDFIFVDGDHTYDGVKKDLDAVVRVIAKGGVIVCDDYNNAQSIRDAAHEFCEKYGFTGGLNVQNPNGSYVMRKNET